MRHSNNGTVGVPARSLIGLILATLLFAALSVSADQPDASFSWRDNEEEAIASWKGRYYLRNETTALPLQERDLSEAVETQEVECSNETRTFTTFVKLGLVFRANDNSSSIDEQSPQNQTNATTTDRDRTGLTRKQRQALEDSFQDAYNELSFQACDQYFRAVDKIQLVVRRPNTTSSSNDTNSNSNVTRRGLLSNPTDYLDWDLAVRSLLDSTLPNGTDYVDSTTEAVTTVFKIEGSCRDCPVTETGQFELFDDSFKRRILLASNQAVEALALKKDSNKQGARFLNQHSRNLQANNNTNATSCVCPVPQTEISESISKGLRSATGGTPSSKQQQNATGLQRLDFLVQFVGEINELEKEGVFEDSLEGIWDIEEEEGYRVDCDDDGGCELEDDDGYWENVDFGGDDDAPFEDDDNWWDDAITDDDDGFDDDGTDDGVDDSVNNNDDSVGDDTTMDDSVNNGDDLIGGGDDTTMDDGVNNEGTDDSPTGISITIGGEPATDDGANNEDTDESTTSISVTIGGSTAGDEDEEPQENEEPQEDEDEEEPQDDEEEEEPPEDEEEEEPPEDEEENNDDGGNDDGGNDDGGNDDGGNTDDF